MSVVLSVVVFDCWSPDGETAEEVYYPYNTFWVLVSVVLMFDN